AGRAVGIVRTRHVALQVAERDVVVTRELPPHLVHQHVTACLSRPTDGGNATVDARHLARRIARRFDVVAKKPDVAVVLRLDVVDLRALPEPGLAGRAARSRRNDQEGDEPGQDQCEFHEPRISAAGPTIPTSRGTTSSTFSRAQKAMSSSRPGGPYVRALNASSAVGNACAISSDPIAASVREPFTSWTIRPAQYASSSANAP